MNKKTKLLCLGLGGISAVALAAGVGIASQRSPVAIKAEEKQSFHPFTLGNKAAGMPANKAFMQYYMDYGSCTPEAGPAGARFKDAGFTTAMTLAEVEKDFSYEAATASEVAADDQIRTLSTDLTKQNAAFRNLDQATSQAADGGTPEYVKDGDKVGMLFSRSGSNAADHDAAWLQAAKDEQIYKHGWSQWQFKTPFRIGGFSFDYKYLDSSSTAFWGSTAADGASSEVGTHSMFQYRVCDVADGDKGATGLNLGWVGFDMPLQNDGAWHTFSRSFDSNGYLNGHKGIDRLVMKLMDFRGALIISNLHYDEPVSYSISGTTGTGYTVTPAEGYDASKVYTGDDFKFTVAPTDGYRIDSVKIGEEALTPDDNGVYTISSVIADTQLDVTVDKLNEWTHYAGREATDAVDGVREYWEAWTDATHLSHVFVLPTTGEVSATEGVLNTEGWATDDDRWIKTVTVASQEIDVSADVHALNLGDYADGTVVGQISTTDGINLGTDPSALDMSGFSSDHSKDGQKTVTANVLKDGRVYRVKTSVLFVTKYLGTISDWDSIMPSTKANIFGYYKATATIDTGNPNTGMLSARNAVSDRWDIFFKGTIDGGGHTIRMKGSQFGQFYNLKNATIKNISIRHAWLDQSNTNQAMLAAHSDDTAYENVTFLAVLNTSVTAANAVKDGSGILFSNGMQRSSFTNCTFDFAGINVATLNHSNNTTQSVTFSGCTFKCAGYTEIYGGKAFSVKTAEGLTVVDSTATA